MVASKPIYYSKTFWLSVLTVIAGTIQLIIGQNLVAGTALTSLGYIYMILRFMTTQPLDVLPSGGIPPA
ncbi:MAG: hypothetical protein ABSB40_12830 [Nitrososphaeria archaeon]|jgi:uncharacterized membrane protein